MQNRKKMSEKNTKTGKKRWIKSTGVTWLEVEKRKKKKKLKTRGGEVESANT